MQAGKTISNCLSPMKQGLLAMRQTALATYSVDKAAIRKGLTSRYLLDPKKHRLARYKTLNNGADKVTGSNRVLTGHRAAHLGAITSSHG